MKSLENYGVHSLSAKEIKETEGGLMIMGALAVCLAVAYLAGTCAALAQGYNPHTRQKN